MLIFLSLYFFALGLFFLHFVARLYILECIRGSDAVISGRIIRKGIFFYEEEQIPVGEILYAELDTVMGGFSPSYRGTKSYRINIVLSSRHTFMTFWHTPGYANKIKKVNRINNFIESSSEQSIIVVEDWRLPGYMTGALLLTIATIITIGIVKAA